MILKQKINECSYRVESSSSVSYHKRPSGEFTVYITQLPTDSYFNRLMMTALFRRLIKHSNALSNRSIHPVLVSPSLVDRLYRGSWLVMLVKMA